jgi:hypothetical protein
MGSARPLSLFFSPALVTLLRNWLSSTPRLSSSTGGKACELHQTNTKLALQRAAAARRALFRLPNVLVLVLLMNYKPAS